MATYIPYINPFRLEPRNKKIDYNNQLPIFDLMTQRQSYQRGIIAQGDYRLDWLNGKEIQLEVFDDTNVTIAQLRNINTGSINGCSITDITPTGWTGAKIKVISITPPSVGHYKFEIFTIGNGWYDSDEFQVKSGESNKDLIEIRWLDSENRLEYGGGFYTGDGGEWTPKAYFRGIKRKIIAPTETSTYTDDPGNPVNLQTTGSKAEQITITDVHETYIDVIEEIIKVDTIYINNQLVTISELSEDKKDEKSDMYDITFIAIRSDNNGYFNYG